MRQLKISKQLTNRDSLSINKYLHEVAKTELLTPDEEVEYATRIQKNPNDTEALEKLVNANLRFVVSVAKQYQSTGIPLEDLISDGNIGLIKAAQKFDPTKGFKFISYAVWWIRQSIMASLGETSRMIRIPANKIAQIKQINEFRLELSHKLEREPSPLEIAQEYDVAIELVIESQKISRGPVSMDAPVQEDEKSKIGDLMEDSDMDRPDDGLEIESLNSDILDVVEKLPLKERIVITEYFGLFGSSQKSYVEIAERLDISKERVRQIKLKAIKRLQRISRNSPLKYHLG
ncbi:MAG: RNA polymerase sigma factor RpoD/SigA [Flavobacteriales bacterium]|jgi:RNA polymerase primary sigma factor|nr:RNA polymerase sigma factor RpoD/SigA [Flavobacteriales bacterium]